MVDFSVAGSKTKIRTRERAMQNTVRVRPTEVFFTQDKGFATFTDGRWLAVMMRAILSKQLDPQALPLLRVSTSADGRMFSLDNRRLHVFRACGVRWINVEMWQGDSTKYTLKRYRDTNAPLATMLHSTFQRIRVCLPAF